MQIYDVITGVCSCMMSFPKPACLAGTAASIALLKGKGEERVHDIIQPGLLRSAPLETCERAGLLSHQPPHPHSGEPGTQRRMTVHTHTPKNTNTNSNSDIHYGLKDLEKKVYIHN